MPATSSRLLHQSLAILSLITWVMLGIGARPSCAAEAYNGAYYKRQAILVSNMDRALTLYRDLLGFKLTGSVNETASDSYTRQVMNIPPQAKVRTAALDAGTVQVRTLLLVEVTGVPLAQPTSTSILTSASVINVHGRLTEIVQAVKNLGLKTLPSHREGDPAKPDDMGTEVAFSDWDGNRILIYEFPHDQSAPSPR